MYLLCYEFYIAASATFVFSGKKGEDPTNVEWDMLLTLSPVCSEDEYLVDIRAVGSVMKYSTSNVYTMTYDHIYIKLSALWLSKFLVVICVLMLRKTFI